MNKSTPEMRLFAKRLMAYEAKRNNTHQVSATAAFYVCEKLRPQLATLMGSGGYRALLSRALALASAEVPGLRAVRVNPEGGLDGLVDDAAQPGADDLFEARAVLLAQLFGLLVAFIGAPMTVRLVREIWSKVPLDALAGPEGARDEKAK